MKTLYHGTSSLNLDSIKTIGLVPGHAKGGDAWASERHMLVAKASKKREPSVFVTEYTEDAAVFARYAVQEMGGDPIIITLHVPDDVFSTFTVDELYEADFSGPSAWRAHSLDPSCIGEVTSVSAEDLQDGLMQALASLMHALETKEPSYALPKLRHSDQRRRLARAPSHQGLSQAGL